ncbi:MAG: flagellar basal body rod protein FlgB [Rhodospirillaceae bacterium]|nr:MAG: flagellar basal body rod protein FlgB [Rhodospirillaceae bacterium]
MDLDNLTLFKMAMTKMDWASQRQKVLSQNVANADTPDYKARDLKKLDFKKILEGTTPAPVKVAQTNPMHLPGTIPQQEQFNARTPYKPYEESPDQNEVTIEDQMEKVGQARADYNTAVTLMEAQLKMFKAALDKGGG